MDKLLFWIQTRVHLLGVLVAITLLSHYHTFYHRMSEGSRTLETAWGNQLEGSAIIARPC